MNTIVLENNAHEGSQGKTWSIQVVGDSASTVDMREAIHGLEHHPAKASRRSLIDMLGLIEKFNFEIRYTEHRNNEDGLEEWLFVLQG